MERQRKIKILALIAMSVAVLGLTVAFAFISTSLKINGSGTFKGGEWDVHFDNLSEAKIIGDAKEVTKPQITDGGITINDLNVSVLKPMDKIVYTVDVVNSGKMTAEISSIQMTWLTPEQSKYIKFSANYSNGNDISEKDVLKAGQKETVTIIIEYKKEVTADQAPKEPLVIDLSLTINYIQSDSAGGDIPPIIDPDTKSILNSSSAVSASSGNTFFGGTIERSKIETIRFAPTVKVGANSIGSWDASASKDGSVIAWYTDNDKNGLYELVVGGNKEVYLSSNCTSFLRNFTNLKSIDFTFVNTSNVTNMYNMFYGCSSLTNLNLSNFDTANVTNMKAMFSGCRLLQELNLNSFNTVNVTDMSNMFYYCLVLTNLNLIDFDTSNVTDMAFMFQGCKKLISLNLNNFNTSNVESMLKMFQYCEVLNDLNLESFNTINVDNMNYMFDGCISLINLNLTSFNTTNVVYMSYMFNDCSSLVNLDLSSFDTQSLTRTDNMFRDCSALEKIDLRKADFSKVRSSYNYMFTNVPDSVLIYVKDQTAKNFVCARNSKLTNVQIVG